MKKISVILILALVLTSFSGISVFASDNYLKNTDINNAVMSVELGTRDLTSEQIKLLQSDKDLATARSKKDAENLLNKAEEEMNNACAQASNALNSQNQSSILDGASILAASTSTLGTDVTYTSTDTGNMGKETDLLSTADVRWGSSYSDADSYTAAIGSASSWAYNAKTVTVSGSGSKNAYIRFYGSYSGNTSPGFMGGTAAAKVRVSVYDVTAGSEIGGSTVKDISDSVKAMSTYNGSISKAVLVSLQAGHTYLFRFGISTSVANYSPQNCISDFYGSTHGVTTTKVTIDYQ